MLYPTLWSGSRFGLKIDYVLRLRHFAALWWDGKGVNAKKSGSGDQTYIRTECERGTAGDDTKRGSTKFTLGPSLVPSRNIFWKSVWEH